MRNFKKFELYYDNATDTNGGAGAGTDESGKETVEELKAMIEKMKAESTKEINSLKSQLGHANKTIENYQQNGKSAEELANLEIEKLKKELGEITGKYNITTLNFRKNELIAELNISPKFADLLEITDDMTVETLEAKIKNIAAKQKEFETEMLKKHSITNQDFRTRTKDTNGKDFVDRMIEKNKTQETDLTKF